MSHAPGGRPEFLPMPAGMLTIPAEADKLFPMRHNDWLRLCKRIAQAKRHASYFGSLAWASIGISASAIIAYFPWVAAASQLPTTAQTKYAYVSPLLIVTAIAAAIVALVCFLANHNTKQEQIVSIGSILEEITEIYEPHKLAQTVGSPAANVPAGRSPRRFWRKSADKPAPNARLYGRNNRGEVYILRVCRILSGENTPPVLRDLANAPVLVPVVGGSAPT